MLLKLEYYSLRAIKNQPLICNKYSLSNLIIKEVYGMSIKMIFIYTF